MPAQGPQSKLQSHWDRSASCSPVARNTEKGANKGPHFCDPAGISLDICWGDAKPGEVNVDGPD